jgi:hypothetical protein
MAKSYKRTLLLSLLMIAPLYAGCEQVSDISSVTETEVPAPAVAEKPKFVQVLMRQSPTTGGTVMSDWVTAGKATTLKFGKYELFIPKGAVKKPTFFRMTILTGSVIGVSLQAWDNQLEEITEFRTPLRLTLPYDEAHIYNIENCKLVLANIVSENDLTVLDVEQAAIDPVSQTITGNITHFSLWSLAKELSPGID